MQLFLIYLWLLYFSLLRFWTNIMCVSFTTETISFFSWFNNVILYFTDFNKYIIIFCISINSNKFTSKFFFNRVCLSISFFFHLCQCDLFHQLLLLVYAWENINQFGSLKQSVVAVFVHLKMLLLHFLLLILLYSLLYHVT